MNDSAARRALYLALSLCFTITLRAQSVAPPAGQHAIFSAEGRGVQIYRCEAVPGDGLPAWIFIAPEATLSRNGAVIGKHGAGPTWSYAGGSVHGKLLAKQPSPDPGAIPWLLLEATAPEGSGPLLTVRFIRRSDTHGGNAPTDGCDTAHIGADVRIPYTATYTFYTSDQP